MSLFNDFGKKSQNVAKLRESSNSIMQGL